MSELELYKKMYVELFNAVTDAIALLDNARSGQSEKGLEPEIEAAIISLRKAQQKTEQRYINE